MVNTAASGKIQLHEVDTADFQTEVFEAIRWYIYHEQEEPIPITKEEAGMQIPAFYNAAKAAAQPGGFDSYQMQIEPYTDVYKSPEQRFQALLGLWERMIMPGVQLGVVDSTPDMDRLMEIAAQYLDLPELKQLLREVTPEEQMMMASGEARQSPTTTRNYVRRSAPGPTRSGNAMTALQLMGQGNGQNNS